MIIKLSLQSKEYLRDLEIFVRLRLHSSYPLREICDVTKTERKECHESYNHLVHLRNPETEENESEEPVEETEESATPENDKPVR